MRLYDAHNHLQDERFGGRQAELLAACRQVGVARMVVNGSCEADWPEVFAVAASRQSAADPIETEVRRSAESPLRILPSFGYHPWYVHQRTADWLQNLIRHLDAVPSAVGEIGLDRWKPGLAYDGQEEVFVAQLRLAAERNLPVSIHCLQAWGRLFDLLKAGPRPERGFLLHSYGGPQEMVKPLADLGAYFSLPGYYAHERKHRQRETFRHVPRERLLLETDAPDQLLPETGNTEGGSWNWLGARRNEQPGIRPHPSSLCSAAASRAFEDEDDGRGRERTGDSTPALSGPAVLPLTDAAGKRLNHPANLAAVYAFAGTLLGEPLQSLAVRVEENFLRLFGG
jgi:TatD DNase family protein